MEKRIDPPDGTLCLLPTSIEYKIYTSKWAQGAKAKDRFIAETMKAIARGCTNAHVNITEGTIKPHGFPMTLGINGFSYLREGSTVTTSNGPRAIFEFLLEGKRFHATVCFSLFCEIENDIDQYINEIALYDVFG